MTVLWDIVPCSLVDVDRRFRGAYSFHHQAHDAISKKGDIFFILAVVRTLNLTEINVFLPILFFSRPTRSFRQKHSIGVHISFLSHSSYNPTMSWARWIQSTPSYLFLYNLLILSFHLSLPNLFLIAGFQTKIVYTFLISPVCAIFILLD
jgi:hypothetical protein